MANICQFRFADDIHVLLYHMLLKTADESEK